MNINKKRLRILNTALTTLVDWNCENLRDYGPEGMYIHVGTAINELERVRGFLMASTTRETLINTLKKYPNMSPELKSDILTSTGYGVHKPELEVLLADDNSLPPELKEEVREAVKLAENFLNSREKQ